jgi:hypothetical protein
VSHVTRIVRLACHGESLSKDDNELLLHNNLSGWAFVLAFEKTICIMLLSHRTGFMPWRLKLV